MKRATLATVLDLERCDGLSDDSLRQSVLPPLAACGAAYVLNHGIPRELVTNILRTCAAIHALDEKTKDALNVAKSEGARGFFTAGDIVATAADDLKSQRAQRREYSSFEVGGEWSERGAAETRVLFADNVWPPLDCAKTVVVEYLETLWDVARRVFGLLARLLDLPANYFAPRLYRPVCQLRLLEYVHEPPEHARQEQRVGLGAHTDYECFTVVVESTPGLEVMARDGTWYSVMPPEGSVVLLTGDLLEVISHATIESVLHRVLPVGLRHSCAFFVGLNPDANVATSGSSAFRVGDHLFARALENFPHLRARVEAGEIVAPPGFGEGNPFKREKIKRMRT